MVGAPADHFCHVLRLLVNGSGPQDSTYWRLLAQKHFNQTGLRKLAIELVEDLGVLRERRERKDTHVVICRGTEFWTCVESKAENFSFFLEKQPQTTPKALQMNAAEGQLTRTRFRSIFNSSCAGGSTQEHVPSCQNLTWRAGVLGRSSLTSTKLTNCRLLLDESLWKHYFHWFCRNTGPV